MNRVDPFLRNKQSEKLSPYMQDILSTNYRLPDRKSQSYEDALAFREREKAMIEATASENESLRKQIAQFHDLSSRAAEVIRNQSSAITALNSKVKAFDVANTSSDGSSRSRSKDPSQSVKGSGERSSDDVPGEVLPASVPDSRGQGSEHSDEGRQGVEATGSEGPSDVGVRDSNVSSEHGPEDGVRSE